MAKATKTIADDTGKVPAETTAPLNLIIEWDGNPRRTRSDDTVETFSKSLATQGQILPLIVLPKDGMFLTIDGETRRRGLNRNVNAGLLDADAPVRIIALAANTPESTLRAIALAANTIREEMNPIEKMEAFRDMSVSGMKPREIGEIFNLSQREVLQHMALGGLIDDARNLVRSGVRQLNWAKAMTQATPDQQKAVIDQMAANKHMFPDGNSVKTFVSKDSYPVNAARFDPQILADKINHDLFSSDGEGAFFTDSQAFLTEQRKWISETAAAYQADGREVRIFDTAKFDPSGWTTGASRDAGAVTVIDLRDDGYVDIHEDMAEPAYARAAANDRSASIFDDAETEYGVAAPSEAAVEAAASGEAVAHVSSPLDEMNPKTAIYVKDQLTASFRRSVATDARLAKVLVTAKSIVRGGGVIAALEDRGFNTDRSSRTSEAFQALAALKLEFDGIKNKTGVTGSFTLPAVCSILSGVSDEALDAMFAWTVAQAVSLDLEPGSMDIHAALGIEPMAGWRIERPYLDLVSTAQARAIAEEVCDPTNVPSRAAKLSEVQKRITDAVEASSLQTSWTGDDRWLPPQVASGHKAAVERLDADIQRQASQAKAA